MSDRQKQLIRGTYNLRPEHCGSVVTIGAYDGVHLGHQAIIKQVVAQANILSLPATAIIFEPLPREFFQPSASVARILPFREKCQALFDQGIERILCLPFNKALSEISPDDFIERILVKGLGVKYLVVGDDFRFGKNRAGDKHLLEKAGLQHDFSVVSADTVELHGERVSSTRIRNLLAENKFSAAAECLGRPFSISGKVVYGKQLGRTIGIPTANIALKRITSPLVGSFAANVLIPDQGRFNAVVNIGVRPTVNSVSKPLLEAHLLDYDDSLYGKRIEVEFLHKLRDEKKFPSVDILKAQIDQDIKNARTFFETL